jgi:hypothetical protein
MQFLHIKALRPAAVQQRVAADRLTAREIGPFLRFRIRASPHVGGVGEGRKAAAEPWSLGGSHHAQYQSRWGLQELP